MGEPVLRARDAGKDTDMSDDRWSIAIHGGAGSMTRAKMNQAQRREYREALATARDAGARILAAGGTALDAVEDAVALLEDDPHFNAGRGAVFTYEGRNELDAAIMDGQGRRAGAVAGVTTVRNPVTLARAVMDDGTHVLLAREGAEKFAAEKGFQTAYPAWFATPERLRQLEELKAHKDNPFDVDLKYGTVGAVARDKHGHVAAATSTGGLTGKRWARIGDSPLIGAGTYADDRSCAVSATGAGEFFIRANVAAQICTRMRLLGESAQAAADAVIAEVGALGGDGGVIVAAADGSTAFAFNTSGMYRARADSDGLSEVGIFAD
jgi:L-asparaginase / beta-aspartyl-peptidase